MTTQDEKNKRRQYWCDRMRRDKYGILPDQYQEMRRKQRGRCAICGFRPTEKTISTKKGDRRSPMSVLQVDHCHKSSRIRGLLCMSCNIALGKFKDQTRLLRRAIKYLERSRR